MSEIYTPEPVDMPSYSGKPTSGDPSKDWMAIVFVSVLIYLFDAVYYIMG